MNCTTSQDTSLASQTQPTQVRIAGVGWVWLARLTGCMFTETTEIAYEAQLSTQAANQQCTPSQGLLHNDEACREKKNMLDCYIAK